MDEVAKTVIACAAEAYEMEEDEITLDTDIREGVLEWIQVSSAYRRQGFGQLIVQELLFRLQNRADFVTVSGKQNDPLDPRGLYERCGFGAGTIWHILTNM